jgi:hypothetical protein
MHIMNEDEIASKLEATLAPEPVEPAAPVEKPKEEAPVAPVEPKPAETPQEPAPASTDGTPPEAVEPAPAEAPEQVEDIDWTQYLTPQAIPTPPTPDENGQVDVQELINYTVNQRLADQAIERQGWSEATKVLPEIATNPQLRDFVHKQRLADVATGGKGLLPDAAKAVKDLFGGAQAQGKAQAQASITVQKAAALETGGANTPPPAPKNDLSERANNGDKAAIQEILTGWVDAGTI